MTVASSSRSGDQGGEGGCVTLWAVRTTRGRATALVGLGALVGGLLAQPLTPVSAGGANATIEVTTTADVVDADDGLVSLREAFALASVDPGDDTIVLLTDPGAGRFEAGTCDEAGGDFDHTDTSGALMIEGHGNTVAVTCGERAIDSGTTGRLTLRDLTVEESGYAPPTGGGEDGGGVRAVGDVLGERLVLRANHVYQGGVGGGLATTGDVELRDSIVGHNTAGRGGGVWAQNIRLVDTIIRTNTARDGGGVRAAQAVTARGSLFRWNTANGAPGTVGTCCGDGGAIFTAGGEVRLIDSTMINNHGNGSGGGINGGDAIVRDSTLRGNSADGGGGAVYTSGPVRIVRSTIRQNRGGSTGGGIRADRGEVLASTVSGNQAQQGGGVWVVDTISMADSTISANTAYNGPGLDGRGGGAFALLGSVTVLRSTVVANRAEKGANVRAADLLVARTSVVGRAVAGASCWGPARTVSHGFNVTDRTGGCGLGAGGGDRVGVADLGLGPLADNGGPTMTHRPSGGILSVIPLADCPTVPDQRGYTRPRGPACEAGSVEVN